MTNVKAKTGLSREAVICLAHLLRLLSGRTADIAAGTGLAELTVSCALLELSLLGLVDSDEGVWRTWAIGKPTHSHVTIVFTNTPPTPAPAYTRTSTMQDVLSRERERSRLHKADLLKVADGKLSDNMLAGLMIRLWEGHYGIPYKPHKSYDDDVRNARILLDEEEGLSAAFLHALFSADMAWVNNKTWSFVVNSTTRNKHLRPVVASIAATLRGQQAKPTSKLVIPE